MQDAALPVFSGIIAGYLCYDVLHYHLHHSQKGCSSMAWLSALRKAHLHHHLRQPESGFGISSPMFDVILRTLPRS